jgi:hypothetical protein
LVSVLTKKQPASGLREQAIQAARQVGPLAKSVPMAQLAALQAQQAAHQAVPLARTAGTSIRHGADDAVAWVTPKVDAARSWAAPQLEQSARAISENLAPMISSMLITAAHKIDVPKRKSRQHGRLVAGSMLLAAAGGLAAAVIMRLRQQSDGFSGASAVGGVPAEPGPDSARSGEAGPGIGFETDDGPDPDMNGHPTIN